MSAGTIRHNLNILNNDAKMVKVGVIGCGRIGLLHLEALTKAPGVLPM